MFRKSIFGFVALATISLLGALAPPSAGAVVPTDQTTLQLTGTSAVVPLVGDFNGDSAEDIFWYGRTSAPDSMWFNKVISSGADGMNTFTTKAVTVAGNYVPLVGDFNGDGIDDVFWYAGGTAADSVWYFHADKSHTAVQYTVNGTYRPVVGNFDTIDPVTPTEGGAQVHERDDIFWFPTGTGNSSLWSGNLDNTFGKRVYANRPPTGAQALVGEFKLQDGELEPSPDIFFYRPGTGTDSLWVSLGDGRFTPSAKTVHGQFRPVVGNFDQTGSRLALPEEAIEEYGEVTDYGEVKSALLDYLADKCFNGNMQKCDDLHTIADEHEAVPSGYHSYGETCGLRRGPGVINCVEQTWEPAPTGLDDILWYGAGTAADKLWINTGSSFTISSLTIGFTAIPTVIRSGPGGYTGGDRILWNSATGPERIWAPTPGGTSFGSTTLADMGTTRKPLAAEFTVRTLGSQYLQDEVLWYAPGNNTDQKETLWLEPGGPWPT